MADVICVDGSVLGVTPSPVVDRHGVPYELTLELTLGGEPAGSVGERCGYFLAAASARLRHARGEGSREARQWPDVDDRFPASSVEGGLKAWAYDEKVDPEQAWSVLQRYLPRDRDLFAFRTRDPDDLSGDGELRCSLRVQRTFVPGHNRPGERGTWRLTQRAVLDAWTDRSVGVRAVLTSGELEAFLDALLTEAAAIGCVYDVAEDGTPLRRPAG